MTDPTEVKKFLFDSNRFDTPTEDENDEPEAPVFSEEELEQAKKVAFETGRAQGLKEAEESREKHVAGLTDAIMLDLKSLFGDEQERKTTFEEETIRLTAQIFKTLYPTLDKENGLNEIKQIIKSILHTQHEQPSILIEVLSEYKTDIEQTVSHLKKQLHGSGEVEITGNDELGPSECRISWKDGGAIRDTQGLCTQILNTLQDGLAEPLIMDNNDKSDTGMEKAVDHTEQTDNGDDIDNNDIEDVIIEEGQTDDNKTEDDNGDTI